MHVLSFIWGAIIINSDISCVSSIQIIWQVLFKVEALKKNVQSESCFADPDVKSGDEPSS